jgi:hypothetical protein
MRVRSRSLPGRPTSHLTYIMNGVYTDPSRDPYRVDMSADVSHPFTMESSTISDQVSGVVSDGRYRALKRSMNTTMKPIYKNGFKGYQGIRMKSDLTFPVNECYHTKYRIDDNFTNTLTFTSHIDTGNPIWERVETHDLSSPSSAAIAAILGQVDIGQGFNSTNKYYNADPYGLHDWFALQDSFNEACDQFIPSSLMLGENIVEHSIFIDAFKAIINPTSLIPTFIKLVPKLIKRANRKNLGQISKELTKQAANDHLSLIFGVLPAISDIRDALEAHQKVESRLHFLSQHSGAFVPIRVRRKISSDVQNFDPSADFGSQLNFFVECESKTSYANMGAWGRVREDINLGNAWQTYLQYFGINKVAGLAWELIPFSFVVDWFTNAQERINHYTRLDFGGPFTELRGISCSKKEELVEVLKLYPGYSSAIGGTCTEPRPVTIAKKHIVSYERYSSIPDTSGVVDLNPLGLFQFAAGASLLIQRLLR